MPLPLLPVLIGGAKTSAIIGGIANALKGLWSLFRGGVSGAVKTALEGLRGTIATVADNLSRYAWGITRALGKVLTALHTVWTRVVWPILRQLPRALGRLRRLIERDLPRLLRLINRIRERLIELYERFWRPMLINIQRIRRMLLILRLLHIHWGDKLDARLNQAQEWVMRPLKIALEHLAVVEQWINVIVSADQLIQETIFGRSAYHYQDPLVRSVLSPFTRPMSEIERLELWPRQAAVRPEQNRAHLEQYLLQGTGPIAEDVAHSLAELRRL